MTLRYLGITLISLLMLSTQSYANPASTYYYEIEEAFTINFLRQSEQKARYLQIRVVLRSNNPQFTQQAETHLPMIQDQLRVLFSQQTLTDLQVTSGRQQLQQSAIEKLNSVFQTEVSQSPISQVYFTSFLWQ